MADINVLYVSYSFPPVNAAASFRALNLSNNLHEHGIHCTIVTKNIEREVHIHRTTDISLLKQIHKSTKVKRARFFSPTIFYLPMKIFGVIKRILKRKKKSSNTALPKVGEIPRDPFIPDHYIEWLPQAFLKAIKVPRKKVDMIYASGPPFTVHLIGYLLKTHFRKPLILEYRDVLTNDPYNPSYGIKENVNSVLEKQFLRNADAVVSVSQPIIDELLKKYDLKHIRHKFYEIPSAFDPSDFKPIPLDSSNKDAFVLTLTTTLYGARKPDLVFQSISRLKKEGLLDDVDFSLNIYGYNEEARFKPELERLNIQDAVHFKGFISHEECLDVLKNSTFNVDLGETGFNYPTIPYHFWEYLGSGKQILHFGYSDHYKARFVKEHNLGIVLPFEAPEKIYEILSQLIKDFKSGTIKNELASDVASKQTWASRVNKLSRIIKKLHLKTIKSR